MISSALGKLTLKAYGWKLEVYPDVITDPKQIMIGFPHTSNIDGIIAVAAFNILNLNYHLLVKKELFRFPFGPILKSLGCIPVDRVKSKNVVQQMVEEFALHDRFSLAVAPEATRGKDGEKRPIRTGFWHIAKATNVPIVLMHADSSNKTAYLFAKVYPSASMDHDLREIQRLYAERGVDVNFAFSPAE